MAVRRSCMIEFFFSYSREGPKRMIELKYIEITVALRELLTSHVNKKKLIGYSVKTLFEFAWRGRPVALSKWMTKCVAGLKNSKNCRLNVNLLCVRNTCLYSRGSVVSLSRALFKLILAFPYTICAIICELRDNHKKEESERKRKRNRKK